jgi:hypothetical protein
MLCCAANFLESHKSGHKESGCVHMPGSGQILVAFALIATCLCYNNLWQIPAGEKFKFMQSSQCLITDFAVLFLSGFNFFVYEIVPVHKSGAISFNDTNGNVGFLSGTFSITRASNETDINNYNLHWGIYQPRNATISQSTLISTKGKESSLNYTFSSTAIPSSATHIGVFTSNQWGEMIDGMWLEISDCKFRFTHTHVTSTVLLYFLQKKFHHNLHDHSHAQWTTLPCILPAQSSTLARLSPSLAQRSQASMVETQQFCGERIP